MVILEKQWIQNERVIKESSQIHKFRDVEQFAKIEG